MSNWIDSIKQDGSFCSLITSTGGACIYRLSDRKWKWEARSNAVTFVDDNSGCGVCLLKDDAKQEAEEWLRAHGETL